MKECKSCGKEISKNAKTCPNCGEDQRNFFQKHKIITGILVLMVLGVVGGLIGGDDEPSEGSPVAEETTADDTEEVEEENEDELEKTEFAVGEPVELDGQVVEVTEVEKSSGSDFDKPSEGKEYVIVHVTIENNGDEEISYNPFNFKMKNSDGQIESMGLITIDNDTSLSSGDLAEGGNVSGTLSFEQPIDDEGLQLIFEPSFWDEDKIIFNISQ